MQKNIGKHDGNEQLMSHCFESANRWMEDRKQSSYADADIATICVTSIVERTIGIFLFLGEFFFCLEF